MTGRANRGAGRVAVGLLLLALVFFSCADDRLHGGSAGNVPEGDGGTATDDDVATDDDAGDDDTGCGDDDADAPVTGVTQSGCGEGTGGASGWTERLILSWDGRDLRVEHEGTCRDEAFVLEVDAEFGRDSLTVSEFNDPQDAPAEARCLFDFSYTILAPPAGAYAFILLADDFGTGAVTLFETDVEFPAGTVARYEVTRAHAGTCR